MESSLKYNILNRSVGGFYKAFWKIVSNLALDVVAKEWAGADMKEDTEKEISSNSGSQKEESGPF